MQDKRYSTYLDIVNFPHTEQFVPITEVSTQFLLYNSFPVLGEPSNNRPLGPFEALEGADTTQEKSCITGIY